MNQLDYLKKFPPIDYFSSNRTVFAAFVNCLDSKDTCDLLMEIFQDHVKRRIVLRKICQDISIDLKPHHERLLSILESQSESMPYQEKVKRASALLYIFDVLPKGHKERLVEHYIFYKSASIREKVYQKLSKEWDNRYISLIEQTWNKWYDNRCAMLIITNFKIEQVLERIDELLQVLDDFQYQKLFKRIALEAPERLEEMKQYDEIAFVYAMTKIGRSISEEEAWLIFKKSIGDSQRRDLLIWCYGQMRLWAVLLNIHAQYETLVMQEFKIQDNGQNDDNFYVS